jgi:hypothetical protein
MTKMVTQCKHVNSRSEPTPRAGSFRNDDGLLCEFRRFWILRAQRAHTSGPPPACDAGPGRALPFSATKTLCRGISSGSRIFARSARTI